MRGRSSFFLKDYNESLPGASLDGGSGTRLGIFLFDEPAAIDLVTDTPIERMRVGSVIPAGHFHAHAAVLPREIFDRSDKKPTHAMLSIRRGDNETSNSSDESFGVKKGDTMEGCQTHELCTRLRNKNTRFWHRSIPSNALLSLCN